jgi:hypothetical protein
MCEISQAAGSAGVMACRGTAQKGITRMLCSRCGLIGVGRFCSRMDIFGYTLHHTIYKYLIFGSQIALCSERGLKRGYSVPRHVICAD